MCKLDVYLFLDGFLAASSPVPSLKDSSCARAPLYRGAELTTFGVSLRPQLAEIAIKTIKEHLNIPLRSHFMNLMSAGRWPVSGAAVPNPNSTKADQAAQEISFDFTPLAISDGR